MPAPGSTPWRYALSAVGYRALLPYVGAASDRSRDDTARDAFDALTRYAHTPAGARHDTWQDAWNALTGATPGRLGVVHSVNRTCPSCNGRGYDFRSPNLIRSMARGQVHGTCAACNGTRTVSPPSFPARHAPPPDGTTPTQRAG